jgi:four helix bundle protein
MSERPHTKLDVWRKAIDFVIKVYKFSEAYPKEEMYGLVSQIRRALVSIVSNIAEGAARNTKKEFIQFLYMTRGSISELDAQLEISRRIGYIAKEKYEELIKDLDEISRMLSGLIKSVEEK